MFAVWPQKLKQQLHMATVAQLGISKVTHSELISELYRIKLYRIKCRAYIQGGNLRKQLNLFYAFNGGALLFQGCWYSQLCSTPSRNKLWVFYNISCHAHCILCPQHSSNYTTNKRKRHTDTNTYSHRLLAKGQAAYLQISFHLIQEVLASTS